MLRALGRSVTGALVVRMTIVRFTTVKKLTTDHHAKDRVARLRELSPLWEMHKDGIDISTIQWSAH